MRFAELNPQLEADGHKLSFECPLHRGERWGVPIHPVEGGPHWTMSGTLPDISLDASIHLTGYHDDHPCNAHFTVVNGEVNVVP